jgi:hypothetical protein
MTTSTHTVTPSVTKLFQRKGVAGQFAVQCTVTYPGEEPRTIEFVGSSYGGPVLMVTETSETWVTEPGRFGKFGKGWVRRFFE